MSRISTKPAILSSSRGLTAIPSLAAKLRQKKIPYITNTPADIESGAFLCLGADYYDVGLKAAELATRIIRGENPAGMPVILYVPEQLTVNLRLAKEYGVTIPDDLITKAAKVVK